MTTWSDDALERLLEAVLAADPGDAPCSARDTDALPGHGMPAGRRRQLRRITDGEHAESPRDRP